MLEPGLTQENVRFRSIAHVDDAALKEVAECFYRPYAILAHVFSACALCIGLILYLTSGRLVYLVGMCIAIAVIQIERVVTMRRDTRLLIEREETMERQLPDVFNPERETLFTDEAIVSATTGIRYGYEEIVKVMKSKHYVILLQQGSLFTIVSKEDLEGGTVDELLSFIDERRK